MRKPSLLFAMTGARGIYGGIASANLNVMQALAKFAEERGAGLTVFSLLEKSTDRPDFLPQSARFRAFQGNKKLFTLSLLQEAAKRPLLCFDHVRLALPLLPLAVTGVVKTVIFAHGSESWKRIRTTSRWSIRCSTLCLTNSHFTLRKMQERISRFNGVACPLGLSPEFALNKEIPNGLRCHIELKAADGKAYALRNRVLLLVARMHPGEREKGHKSLIDALPQVLERFPDVQLVFAGPGEDRSTLQEYARLKGVSSAIFLPGFLPTEMLQRLYQQCYAFIMPSKQEGFGLAYLEAMNYAKACVGCFDQGAEDIIVHNETGYLVHDPNNHQELLQALFMLLRDPERTHTLGRNGFERLHECFTSVQYQQRIKEQISRILQ